MEEAQNQTTENNLPQKTLKPLLKNILFFIKVIGGIILGYVAVGSILILINPLFGYIVLYPIFTFQSFLAQSQNSNLHDKISKSAISSIILSAQTQLSATDCTGQLFGKGFGHETDYPEIVKYAALLNVGVRNGRFVDQISFCKTPKGNFVFKNILKNNAETSLHQIYKDNNGVLEKLLEFEYNFPDGPLLKDIEGNVYLGFDMKNIGLFVYDADKNIFLKVKDIPLGVQLCYEDNSSCSIWDGKKFSTKANTIKTLAPATTIDLYENNNTPIKILPQTDKDIISRKPIIINGLEINPKIEPGISKIIGIQMMQDDIKNGIIKDIYDCFRNVDYLLKSANESDVKTGKAYLNTCAYYLQNS